MHPERPEQIRPRDAAENEQEVRLTGPILYVTQDPDLIRAQLAGYSLTNPDDHPLLTWVSTDAMIPAKDCRDYTGQENLGFALFTGIDNGAIQYGDLAGKFEAVVLGASAGRGSSREHPQVAARQAGIRYFIAPSFERIFEENCANQGIFCLTLGNPLTTKLLQGEVVSFEALIQDVPPITQDIMRYGGLMAYAQARREGNVTLPEITTGQRPMTIAEKIIAKHTVQNGRQVGVGYVKPGDQSFVEIDTGYSYEVQAILSQAVAQEQYPQGIPVTKSAQFIFFEDHSAMQPDNPASQRQRAVQKEFVELIDATLYPIEEGKGVQGICHTVMVEDYILPGQVIVGNDSHTDSGGVGNALAIGKGATDLAAALVTGDVLVTVPETIRFNLFNSLPPGVTGKDLMLHILSLPKLRDQLLGSKRVFEFGGEGLNTLAFDDQFVLTNMAIEGQAFTGIVGPNDQLVNYFVTERGMSPEQVEDMLVYSDPDAEYAHTFDIDLSAIEQMVALPGDTQKGKPLSKLKEEVAVDIAYIGSCTGGKLKDLQEVATVLRGRKIKDSVRMYVQASSQKVLQRAKAAGYIDDIVAAGATFLPPGCGACMNAGPGSSVAGEVTISDTNRNFTGRMGGGNTYLANPAVVAASAVAGKIAPHREADTT